MISEDQIHLDWIEDGNDIIDYLIKEERKKWLYKEIYALPEKEREIMLLSIQSEFTDQIIAKLVNLSPTNVKTIRFRVKQKLIKKSEELK